MQRTAWLAILIGLAVPSPAARADAPKDDGYRGIWYFNQRSADEYRYKCSGGFATYPQQHVPIAVYSKAAHKPFFCYGTGGEIVLWTSGDQGQTWTRLRQLTRGSPYNHTYVRRPLDAHADFYALWADGHAREPSPCRLYFTNRTGDRVWRLPERMTGDFARPEVVP